jgi:hypothetical protein
MSNEKVSLKWRFGKSSKVIKTSKIHVLFRVYGSFNDAVRKSEYIASNDGMIDEWWIGKYMEGSGCGPIEYTVPALAWRDWKKTRKILVSVAGLWAKIWSRNLQNMKQECFEGDKQG